MSFQKPTIDFLLKMGWVDGRHIDIASYANTLVADGYQLFPAARIFLEEFGGLDGEMPAFRKTGAVERIHFDPTEAIDSVYREKISTYERRIGEAMVVVGEAYNGHLTLLLSENGRMFGGYDDYLCLLGNSATEGLASLFEKREVIEIL